MANWTPGPWRHDDGGGCREIWSEASGQKIVTAFTEGLANDPIDLANARLIAKAPEMAALLASVPEPNDFDRMDMDLFFAAYRSWRAKVAPVLARLNGDKAK